MTTVEFFFDASSPWTYLAFTGIEKLCAETGATLVWKPILVGGVFNAVNRSVYDRRENPVPAKDAYYKKDMQDWAKVCGITIGEPKVFPLNSVKVMRGAFVAEAQGKLSPYLARMFKAYWTDLRDISQDNEIRDIVQQVGLDPDQFIAAINEQAVKDKLRANTDELIRRGGFGSPTIFVDGDDMYFGNDRLGLVRIAIERKGRR
jgi:2-hydroxychromene-2-carboxylate isomerase